MRFGIHEKVGTLIQQCLRGGSIFLFQKVNKEPQGNKTPHNHILCSAKPDYCTYNTNFLNPSTQTGSQKSSVSREGLKSEGLARPMTGRFRGLNS